MISSQKAIFPIHFNFQPSFRIPHAAFFIPLLLLMTVGPASAQVRVNVTQPAYTVNEELSLRAAVDGNPGQEGVDLYFALLAPGIDRIFFMGPDLLFYPDPIPALADWNPVAVPEIPLINYTFNGFEPEGGYFWAAAMFLPGRPLSTENLIGELSVVRFDFTAPSILSWFPQQGTVLNTTTPDLSLLFKKPVSVESVIQRMEIKIESLGSGKIAEVLWVDGQRVLRAFLPPGTLVTQQITATDYIQPIWTEENKQLNLHVSTYTHELTGETYSLHFGGSYRLTLKILDGTSFADGSPIPSSVIGPLDFSIAR